VQGKGSVDLADAFFSTDLLFIRSPVDFFFRQNSPLPAFILFLKA
jgi:hypothetical protein